MNQDKAQNMKALVISQTVWEHMYMRVRFVMEVLHRLHVKAVEEAEHALYAMEQAKKINSGGIFT